MSQAGIVDVESSNPQIPTSFVANSGTAIPIANTLEILGAVVAAHSIPLETTASGNTITIEAQYSSASASSVATNAGLSSFNSSYFTVDANGFVTLSGGSALTFDGDTGTATPSAGVITISGGSTGLTTTASGSTVSLIGILKLANGGTNANLTASNGGIFYSTATAGAILAGTATARQMLQSGTSTTPAWSTATWPATTTINQILYSSSANVVAGLATANNGVLITSATGVPSILPDGTTGQVLTATTGAPPSWSSVVSGVSSVTGTANQILASPTTGAVVLSLIGPYTPSTYTAHSVLIGEGTSSIVGVGPTATSGQILQSQGSTTDPAFSTATYPSTTTINQILYSSSANVVAGLTSANNGVLTTGTSGIPAITQLSSNGQLIIGSASGAPIAATLTAGPGITITNGANSITIASNDFAFAYTNVNNAASPYTVLSSDQYISVDCSGGAVTLKFLNVPTANRTWVVKDRTGSASTNNISITTVGGSVTIDGQTTYTIDSNYGAVNILANATPTYEIY